MGQVIKMKHSHQLSETAVCFYYIKQNANGCLRFATVVCCILVNSSFNSTTYTVKATCNKLTNTHPHWHIF